MADAIKAYEKAFWSIYSTSEIARLRLALAEKAIFSIDLMLLLKQGLQRAGVIGR